MNIPASEYEQRRNVFQLCDWINSKLRDLKTFPVLKNVTLSEKGKISRSCLKKLFLLPVWACPFGVRGAMYRLPV